MAATHLTARLCASARPKLGKDGKPTQTAFPDDDPRGLELRVSAEGRKVWTFRYRTLDGQQKRITLGQFVPGEEESEMADGEAAPLTLRAARRKARAARAVVEDGGDPAGEQRRKKAEAKAQPIKTVNDLLDAYLGACERGEWKPKGRKKSSRTIKDERAILKRYVRPAIGSDRVESADGAGVKRILRGLVDRGIGAQANRCHAVLRQAFAFGLAEGRLAVNPATGFAPMANESPRARTLADAELSALWATWRNPGAHTLRDPATGKEGPLYLSRQMAIILQLAALLLQRRSEIAGMRIAELDLEQAIWTIPAERSKSRRPHVVPLGPRAVELIREALALAALDARTPACVFPGRRDSKRPISSDAVSHALSDTASAAGVDGITLHDLRRTGATALASERLGFLPFIVSHVLGHSDTGGGAAVTFRHYALHSYMPEKRKALEAWERLLRHIVGEALLPSNVQPLRAAP